jgi:hypothetical protein
VFVATHVNRGFRGVGRCRGAANVPVPRRRLRSDLLRVLQGIGDGARCQRQSNVHGDLGGGDVAEPLRWPHTYNEPCGFAPALPDSGTASGPFSISGGVLTLGGTVVGTATLSGNFAWARTLAGVTISVTNVSLANGGNTVATTSGVGVGAGVFGPPIPAPGALPPSCANEEPVSVAVMGTYSQPG